MAVGLFGRGGRDQSATARLAWVEALMAAGGESIALFDPALTVLIAAPPLTKALDRPAEAIEGVALANLGLPPATTGRLRTLAETVAMKGEVPSFLDPAILAGRDLRLTAIHSPRGAITGLALIATTNGRAETARFLSAANHDLRQPIQALHLFHHLLSSRLTDRRLIDFADRLGQSIDAADRSLVSLVQAARLDAGLSEVSRRTFPLALPLIPLIEEFRDRAQSAGLEFRVHFGPAATDTAITSDQSLFEVLVRHVLDNAIRFTNRGGVILGLRRRGERIVVEVWDTGPGLAPAEITAAWEDFRRVHPPARSGIAGMGLGLAIVRRIAALLDLDVKLRSRPGRGTKVEISARLEV